MSMQVSYVKAVLAANYHIIVELLPSIRDECLQGTHVKLDVSLPEFQSCQYWWWKSGNWVEMKTV